MKQLKQRVLAKGWFLRDFSYLAEGYKYLNICLFSICIFRFADLSPSSQRLWMASGLFLKTTYFAILFCLIVDFAYIVSFYLLLLCGCVIANRDFTILKFLHARVSDESLESIQYQVRVIPKTLLMASSLRRPTWAAPICCPREHPRRAPACSRPRRPWAEWGWEQ